MKNTVILLTSIILIGGCRNYDNETYYNVEHQAINDLILEMTDYVAMSKMNNYNDRKMSLYILPILDTLTVEIRQPYGWTTGFDGAQYSKEKIEENENIYLQELEVYKKERRNFKVLTEGRIQPRSLDFEFNVPNMTIKISNNNNVFNHKLVQNDFGVLGISRIVFNRKMNKGYLSYIFYCGQGCVWDNNIEIQNISGKWQITEYYSGGIA